MIHIDGAYGEGGGQILRTSASLAAITGRSVRIENIRARRKEPGLKAQHLTAIQAAMRVCHGRLEGGEVGATEVTLLPGALVQPGTYEFDIGTAGSAALVFQTLLMPLLLAPGESRVTIHGGTHNTNAPTSDYLQTTFLRAAHLPVEVAIERLGFFPKGGGILVADFRPRSIIPIRLPERGRREKVTAVVSLSEALPADILRRAQAEIERRAREAGWLVEVVFTHGPSLSPGMAVHLHAEYDGAVGGFTGLGRRGLPTERVIEDAWAELAQFDASAATVDEHLADQLILPALFAKGRSEFLASRVTEHLRTMAWLVPQFDVGYVAIEEEEGRVTIDPGFCKDNPPS